MALKNGKMNILSQEQVICMNRRFFILVLLLGFIISGIIPGTAWAVTSFGAGGWNSTPIEQQLNPVRPAPPPRPPRPPHPLPYPYGYGPYGPVIYDPYYVAPFTLMGPLRSSPPGDPGQLYNDSRTGEHRDQRPVVSPPQIHHPSGPPTETTYELNGTVFPGQGFILLRFIQEGNPVGMKVKTDSKTRYVPEGYVPRPGDPVKVRYYHKGPDNMAHTIESTTPRY